MIIDNRIKAATGVYTNSAVNSQKNTGKTAAVQQNDQIVLSAEAQSFSQVLQKIQGSSVRMDKVEQYTAAVQQGTYQVDSSAIAGKMLQMRF